MPRGDGTGPMGMGPMTGRAAGYCAGYAVPGFANPVPGYGFGLGLGYGRGRGRAGRGVYRWTRSAVPAYPAPGFFGYPAGVPEDGFVDEKTYFLETQRNLETQISHLNSQLNQVKDHLQGLEDSGQQQKENG